MLTDNLKLGSSYQQYWINSVSRLEDDLCVYPPPPESGISSVKKLSLFVDSAQLGFPVNLLLNDNNEGQTISAPDVVSGYSQQMMHAHQGSPKTEAALQELIDIISTTSCGAGGSSSLPLDAHSSDFLAVQKKLCLEAILREELSSNMDICMNLHEYNENQLNSACPIEDPVAFLFKTASQLFLTPHIPPARVSKVTGRTTHFIKWLHAHKASRRVILSLAVKYELDHRFVSRVFSLGRDKAEQVSFFDMHYGVTANAASAASSPNNSISIPASSSLEYTPISSNLLGAPSIERPMWVFMVVPILRLSEHSKDSLRKYQAWLESASGDATGVVDETLDAPPCVEIVVEHCNLAMFVSGIAEGGTLLSFSSEWVELMRFNTVQKMAERTSAMNNGCCRRQPRNILDGSASGGSPITCEGNDTGVASSPSDRVSAQLSIFSKTLSEIGSSNSHLRTGNAHSLFLNVLDDITKHYLLIGQAYRACILDRRINEFDNLNPTDVQNLQKYIAQLSQLDQVVRTVADMTAAASFKRLWINGDRFSVSSILSNLASVKGNVSLCTKRAELIVKRYTLHSQRKPRFTFQILALVTCGLIPVCALLKHLCGKIIQYIVVSSMPRFTWEHEYSLIWCILICIASYTSIVHRR